MLIGGVYEVGVNVHVVLFAFVRADVSYRQASWLPGRGDFKIQITLKICAALRATARRFSGQVSFFLFFGFNPVSLDTDRSDAFSQAV